VTTTAAPLHFDPTDPAVRADPFPLFARLREEDPVHWSPMFKGWIVTRHADVQAVLNGPQMSADRITPFYTALPGPMQERVKELVQLLGQWLVFRDPPDHTRLRGVMMKPFTPKAMAAIRPNIEAIVDLLLDDLAKKDEADIVADFTTPLPAYVIMDMLGVPRDMFAPMKSWSDDIRLFIGTARGVPNKYEKAQHGLREMSAWFRKLIAERRAEPRNDVLTALVQARDESSDGKGPLSDDELVSASILFLFGGHETTTNLLGNASLMLMRHPEEKRRFLADPALTNSAVEEFLRYDGPSFSMVRIVATEHDLGGRTFAKGDRIFAIQNSANRDAAEFTDPDRFDIARTPNRHVTFGYGLHFCIGAPLARMEAQIALPHLHQRYPDMQLAIDEPAWIDSMVMRGTTGLPVKLGKRR
jgi:cytochrome P450